MKHQALCVGLLALLVACARTNRHGATSTDTTTPDHQGGATSVGGAGASPGSACELPPPALVRLSFPEIVSSLAQLLGEGPAAAAAAELQLHPSSMAFPPLRDGAEGETINAVNFANGDLIAQNAASYVREHFKAVTGCEPDHDCTRKFVLNFAEKAFRRPLSDAETQSLTVVLARAKELQAPPEQAAEAGVTAVLDSPHFLYRTELGTPTDDSAELRLTDYELASHLAFFLTGAPPDDALLKAAADGQLASPEHLDAQATRLLLDPATRKHQELLLANQLRVGDIQSHVLDPAFGWSLAAADAAEQELRTLLADTLWTDPVAALLTSRRSRLDAHLATFYGISFPPAGMTPDADGFVSTLLPETRAGLLMRSGTSVITSLPDGASIVQRGLWVNFNLLCHHPKAETARPDTFEPIPQGSPRELALQRMSDPGCRSCHLDIDPYGLALEDLDAVGRFRSEDADGHPIDASATLPALAGGAKVQSSLELSSALPSAALALCFSQRFLDHALSLGARSEAEPGCVAQELAAERADSANFSEILRQIVSSPSFSQRRRE